MASQATYRKNAFSLSDAERETITERWGFAFEALGYRMRLPGQDTAPAEHPALISA